MLRSDLHHPDAVADEVMIESGRVVGADQQSFPGPRDHRTPQQGRAPVRVRRPNSDHAVGCEQPVEPLLENQPAAIEDTDPSAHLLDLGQQVAGQEDRRAAALRSISSRLISWMP